MECPIRGAGSPWALVFLTWVAVCLFVSPFLVFRSPGAQVCTTTSG